MRIGDPFPDFKMKGLDSNRDKRIFTNEDFFDENLIVFFYPKDETPGCIKEACNFNLLLPQIKIRANLIGVSADSIESHQSFQENYLLNFPLLTDKNKRLASQLGIVKDVPPHAIGRTTFLIDKDGIIMHIWRNVNVIGHDKEVLDLLRSL